MVGPNILKSNVPLEQIDARTESTVFVNH